MTKKNKLTAIPYVLWLFLFVLAPIALLIYKSFFDIDGNATLANYGTYFTSWTYLKMSVNSVIYAAIITAVTLVISYPTAYFLTKLKHKQLWLMLIILPTWINLLLKAYAFIGIFGQSGAVNGFLNFMGLGSQQILFTDFSFIFVAAYIEIPFMVLPIGGNRVITLGTAIEEHFLVTQNWGMGATIGMVLIITMFVVMYLTRERGGKA